MGGGGGLIRKVESVGKNVEEWLWERRWKEKEDPKKPVLIVIAYQSCKYSYHSFVNHIVGLGGYGIHVVAKLFGGDTRMMTEAVLEIHV